MTTVAWLIETGSGLTLKYLAECFPPRFWVTVGCAIRFPSKQSAQNIIDMIDEHFMPGTYPGPLRAVEHSWSDTVG